MKVVKFGGSSLADAEQFKKVRKIVSDDPERRYVVASAPGKRFPSDEKVTDMLYRWHDTLARGGDGSEIRSSLTARFADITARLGIDFPIQRELEAIAARAQLDTGSDFAASRGEYLNAMILAEYLGFAFIDAADVIFFGADGQLDMPKTRAAVREAFKEHDRAVIPGFFGKNPDGTIKTFSRGGSDVTGSIVAAAAMADVYENWTDVSGMLVTDPRIVKDPAPIERITYRELRELSYMGASVLHEEAVFPVRDVGIPINIRNTNDPAAKGTMIVSSIGLDEADTIITGIAGKTGFSVIHIEKDRMNSEVGFGMRVLQVLSDLNISFEHLPSGIDTMSVIVNTEDISACRKRIMDDICNAVCPDAVSIEDGMALIAVVGRGMVRTKGVAGRIFTAIANASVNIRMLDQGSSELNIILGVDEEDYPGALEAIYREFSAKA